MYLVKEKKVVLTVVVSLKKMNPVARPVPPAVVEGAEPAHQSPQVHHNTTTLSYQVRSQNVLIPFSINHIFE